MPISSRLIVNPAALKLKRDRVQPLLEALAGGGGGAPGKVVSGAPLVLRRLDSAAPGFDGELAALIAFEAAQDPAIDATVARIVADVRARGDAALLEYTARFDRLPAASVAALEIPAAELRRAFEALPAAQRAALETAAARIRAFHERQKMASWTYRDDDRLRAAASR